jgi:cellulose synthase/poly-beta-1,6-N-acetylglucosamine synthase-like glycosyltransferase
VVILCLRGTDPFLKNCIQGLLNQDYPRYQIRIVVDSPHDPAHIVLSDILAGSTNSNIVVEDLYDRSTTCSLKCSSLRQVMRSLDPSCEIVAQLDADTIAHPTWLRELATALMPDDVGVATGNRWYMPNCLTVGALVRYTWNAAAVVQMYWHRIAWGGTLALKARVLRESDLLDKWGLAFCEDTMLHAQLKKLGLRVDFVPSLMMINRENISLTAFYRWVSRQMVNVRLYHPAWPAVAMHGFVSAAIPLLALALLLIAVLQNDLTSTAVILAGLWIYSLSLLIALIVMVKKVRAIATRRGEPSRWISGWRMLYLAGALPLTQAVHTTAIVAGALTKSTTWRGIRYFIDGPWRVRMEEYSPYPATMTVSAEESL